MAWVTLVLSSVAWAQQAASPPPLLEVEAGADVEALAGACFDGDATACDSAAEAAARDGRTSRAEHLRQRAAMLREERLASEQAEVRARVPGQPDSERRLLDDDDGWPRPAVAAPTTGRYVGTFLVGVAGAAVAGVVGALAGVSVTLFAGSLGATLGGVAGAVGGAGLAAALTVAWLLPSDTFPVLGGMLGAGLGAATTALCVVAFWRNLMPPAVFLYLLPIPVGAVVGALLQARSHGPAAVSAAFVPAEGGGHFVLSGRF